jgi:ribosomal protein L37AE/L43A
MNGWANNGAKPKWTDEEMLAAMKRVQAMTAFCGVSDYKAHRLPTDPTAEAIVARFRTWNKAKLKAGLKIQVKMVRDGERMQCDEAELNRPKRTLYPCHKCGVKFKGLGRRNGQWHCEECTRSINFIAAGMGW